MNRFPPILLVFALLSFSVFAEEKPNIILIMPDDMGYGDIAAHGNPVIRTPEIDRLSRESGILSDFYVSPVCSPTRASLMTGRYNHRTRVIDTFKGRSMMDPEEVTVAEALREGGYTTGIFGKWHLGDNYPLRPMEQGFDEVLVHKGGGLAQPSEPIENERRYTDPILFHNGEQVQTKGYCTDVYFDAAMSFIDSSLEKKKPFFVYLPPNAPHGPFHDVPEDLYQYYSSLDLSEVCKVKKDLDVVARVYAMVENVDWNIGRLRKHLEEKGVAENTILIFMVDNGPNTSRFVGPFRGMKSNVLEGGIRSPFFFYWPGRVKPGIASDRIAAHIDVMPTLLEAAGVSVPEGLHLDGRSLLPLLERKEEEWPDRVLVLQGHRGNAPVPTHNISARNQHWTLVHPTGFGPETMPDNVPFELYDMTNDQGETVNLIQDQPEIATELRKAFADWLADVSSTREDNYEPPRIIVGNDAESETVLSIQDWRVGTTDGWGDSGKWMLRVEGDFAYKVKILWDAPIREGKAMIRIAGKEIPLVLEDGATAASAAEPVTLPAGETALSVEFSGEKKQPRMRHVVLTRQG